MANTLKERIIEENKTFHVVKKANEKDQNKKS